jgi:uncharacterized protein HemX
MDRLVAILLFLLLVVVLGFGLALSRGQQQAHDDTRELACIERVNATASIAVLVPRANVDNEGRLESVQTLGDALENC